LVVSLANELIRAVYWCNNYPKIFNAKE
jgi:hypothetical protein